MVSCLLSCLSQSQIYEFAASSHWDREGCRLEFYGGFDIFDVLLALVLALHGIDIHSRAAVIGGRMRASVRTTVEHNSALTGLRGVSLSESKRNNEDGTYTLAQSE